MGELIEDTGAGSTPPFHKEFSSGLHPYSVTGLLRTPRGARVFEAERDRYRPLKDGYRMEGHLDSAELEKLYLPADGVVIALRASGDLKILYGMRDPSRKTIPAHQLSSRAPQAGAAAALSGPRLAVRCVFQEAIDAPVGRAGAARLFN